jgi:hypothetical protein
MSVMLRRDSFMEWLLLRVRLKNYWLKRTFNKEFCQIKLGCIKSHGTTKT